MKHTDIDKSQVLFKAYGKCGWSRYGEEDDPNISMLGSVVFGNNGLTVSQIGKLLAGKRASLSNAINQRYYTFTGSANPVDLETLMQLIHAEFTNVSKDTANYQKTIKETLFRNAKESLLKSFDELVKTANGFWLDTMWRKVSSGIDFYTDRRKLIEQLTPDELLSFMKVFQTHAHVSETLMQPE